MYEAIPFYRRAVNSMPGILPVFSVGTNLISQSQTFSAWSLTDVTIDTIAVIAPDYSLSAFKMIEGNLNTFHRASKATSAVTAGVSYTLSVYVKPVERTWMRLIIDSNFDPSNPTVWFNLSGSGGIGQTIAVDHMAIIAAPNGYFRVQMSMQAISSGVCAAYVQMVLGDGQDAYAGDGTSGLIPWGAQLNPGIYATGYKAT